MMRLNWNIFQQSAWTLTSVLLVQIWTIPRTIMGKFVRQTRIVLIVKALMFAIVVKDRDSCTFHRRSTVAHGPLDIVIVAQTTVSESFKGFIPGGKATCEDVDECWTQEVVSYHFVLP